MENEGKEPQVYEVGLHIVPSVSPEDAAKTVQALKEVIVSNGGTIIAEETPKMMRLAYTMVRSIAGKNDKYDTASFGWVKYEAAPHVTVLVRDAITANKDILRHLITRTVRENTMYGQHVAIARVGATARAADAERREAAKKEEGGPVSEEEVDKAIEDLVKE